MDHRASTSSSGNGIQLPPGFVLDEATKNAMQLLLSQQYNTTQPQVQTNDTIILTQNALAANVPTLHTPTIMSYLGYGNTFQPSKDKSFAAKYSKLMEVIDEIGRDVRPLYTCSKNPTDRIRRQIIQARQLVRECLVEVDRAQR